VFLPVLLSLILFHSGCKEKGTEMPQPNGPIILQEAFPKLTFTRPVDFQHAGDNSNRVFVVEQRGVIKVFQNNPEVNESFTFLDIEAQVEDEGNEEGLLGLAFHPDYANNGYFYVNYTASNP